MGDKLLLLGATGFAGRHFAAAAREAGLDVVEAAREGAELRCDLLDPESVDRCVAAATPGVIVNLAGSASVHASLHDPTAAFAVNATGVVSLLDAATRRAPGAHVICVSSGEVYGDVATGELPASEDLMPQPASPYAASKAAMEVACGAYARSSELRIAVVRAFNHTGPGQSDAFAASSFARQIAAAERAGEPEVVLRTGNLDAVRDFCDVRDIVRAYLAIAEHGLTGTYNACSGRGARIGDLLDLLAAASALPIDLETDPDRVRRGEPEALYGSPERLARATGWRCEIPLERTVRDLLDWWRSELGCPPPRRLR